MSDEVRTRFAPSPTGYLHLGGLRTALYTYLFAKKHGGKFILRIEDTDQEREVPGAVDLIYKSMRQAGLTYDEGPDVGGEYGPYIQTQRRDLYPKYAWELVEKGGAYCCFCTKEELEADRKAAEAKGETYKYNKKCLHNVSLEEAKRRIAAQMPLSEKRRLADVIIDNSGTEQELMERLRALWQKQPHQAAGSNSRKEETHI